MVCTHLDESGCEFSVPHKNLPFLAPAAKYSGSSEYFQANSWDGPVPGTGSGITLSCLIFIVAIFYLSWYEWESSKVGLSKPLKPWASVVNV